MARGARYAMTTGTWWTPTLCVGRWDVEWLWLWAAALSLDKARDSLRWITWTAREARQTLVSVAAWAGVSTTVTTMRMWELPVGVKTFQSSTSTLINSREKVFLKMLLCYYLVSRASVAGGKRLCRAHHNTHGQIWIT